MAGALSTSALVGRLLSAAALLCLADACDFASTGPYAAVSNRMDGISFKDLPGFTRGVGTARDHALITPESRVYTGLFGWKNTQAAFFVTPAMGAQFSFYQVHMGEGSESGAPLPGVWRFIFILEGTVTATEQHTEGGSVVSTSHSLIGAGSYAFFPADHGHKLFAEKGAKAIIYERKYVEPKGGVKDVIGDKRPSVVIGTTDSLPNIDTPGEIFGLKKLLPQTLEFDVNFHVMDFKPGESLYVKEIHYNQHGLMLLEGQGIYRLNDNWYPVQAGDVIWMAPYVTQWYAALGKERSRYIIYKDTNRDPLDA